MIFQISQQHLERAQDQLLQMIDVCLNICLRRRKYKSKLLQAESANIWGGGGIRTTKTISEFQIHEADLDVSRVKISRISYVKHEKLLY